MLLALFFLIKVPFSFSGTFFLIFTPFLVSVGFVFSPRSAFYAWSYLFVFFIFCCLCSDLFYLALTRIDICNTIKALFFLPNIIELIYDLDYCFILFKYNPFISKSR